MEVFHFVSEYFIGLFENGYFSSQSFYEVKIDSEFKFKYPNFKATRTRLEKIYDFGDVPLASKNKNRS